MLTVDRELIAKYNQSGPRYTSYPTAPLFNTDISQGAYVKTLQERDPETPLSLYVHIPYCHHLCWYCGCHMKVSRKEQEIQKHLTFIHQEIKKVSAHLKGKKTVKQVHFGGGTPNYLKEHQILELMIDLRAHFHIERDAEISIELDPRQLNHTKIETLVKAGFNRVSMGLQDLNPKVQKAINRIQPFEMVFPLMAQLRSAGIDSINVDLIYGLPHQTEASFVETLEGVMDMDPDRIALFNFAYLPRLKPQMKLISPDDLPSAEEKMGILTKSIEVITGAGYDFIGMDHFAKPNDPLSKALKQGTLHRNFQGYTTMPDLEMIGFGMSAISMFDGLYVQNKDQIPEYESAIGNDELASWRGYELTEDDRIVRRIINDLMCLSEIDTGAIEAYYHQPFDEAFPGVRERLMEFVEDGLLTVEGALYKVTMNGRLLLRNIAMVFDRYLPEMQRNRQMFSKTV